MATDATAPAVGPADLPHLIVIGSSAGGLQALTSVLEALPATLPAAIVIVQHISPHIESNLAEILNRRTALPVQRARAGMRIEAGQVYVAPPDLHLSINRFARLHLQSTERVNYTRPSVDPLFTSAAEVFGNRVIAVVLTGFGHDGAVGAWDVKRFGGTVIVQDEATSQNFGMPGSAIETGSVDQILPLPQIPKAILALLKGQ